MQPTTPLEHKATRTRIRADIDDFLKAGGRIKQCAPGESGDKAAFGNPLNRQQRKKRQKKFNQHM